jgi:acetyl/propionyl-CoA carboxylase alpha subunit
VKTVLIANRGEVVVRVARTLRAMGLRSIGIFAPPDRGAPHTEAVDEAREVTSYLDIPSILAAAKGVDALHPGWGFLSQNPAFADACAAAGLIFVGPSAAAMRLMGDKAAARATAIQAGVPVAPGGDDLSPAAIEKLGLPVMLKAVAGGGGKGLRRIDDLRRIAEEVESARREAVAAFGDGRMFAEKLVAPARHVEIQLIGQVAFGERDCSLQRRFQKIIEEAPGVDAGLRAKMEEAAIRLAKAAGYANAGTVEFLLRPDGRFYFMEMNTRLQVEHPVTEAVRGVDLVRLQMEAAQGLPIAPPPPLKGHAIEARLYAEDPDAGFLPMSGRVLKLAWPAGARVEHALREGLDVTPDYDPMLAKLIAHGSDREDARKRLVAALRNTVLLGVQTNQSYLLRLLESKSFIDNDLAIGRLPDVPPEELPLAAWHAAAKPPISERNRRSVSLAWETLGRWRL